MDLRLALPDEIWSDVLRGFRTASIPNRIRLTHVCHQWRRILLNARWMWDHLIIRHNSPMKIFPLLLKRSQTLPLELHVSIGDPDFDFDDDDPPHLPHDVNDEGTPITSALIYWWEDAFLSAFLPEAQRIRALTIQFDEDTEDMVLEFMEGCPSFQQLAHLQLEYGLEYGNPMPFMLPLPPSPQLTSLVLGQVTCDEWTFVLSPCLENFELRSVDNLPCSLLLDIADFCHRLRHLCFVAVSFDAEYELQPNSVQIASLLSFQLLQVDADCIIFILEALDFSTVARVSIGVSEDDDAWQEEETPIVHELACDAAGKVIACHDLCRWHLSNGYMRELLFSERSPQLASMRNLVPPTLFQRCNAADTLTTLSISLSDWNDMCSSVTHARLPALTDIRIVMTDHSATRVLTCPALRCITFARKSKFLDDPEHQMASPVISEKLVSDFLKLLVGSHDIVELKFRGVIIGSKATHAAGVAALQGAFALRGD